MYKASMIKASIPVTILQILEEIEKVTDEDLESLNDCLPELPSGIPSYQLNACESRIAFLILEEDGPGDESQPLFYLLDSMLFFMLSKRLGKPIQRQFDDRCYQLYQGFILGFYAHNQREETERRTVSQPSDTSVDEADGMGDPPTSTRH